jgi:UDP-N-acetylglucosamine 2-epimerase (hydrolysing)
MLPEYGSTWIEVGKLGVERTHLFMNQSGAEPLESIIISTIEGISKYLRVTNPEVLVVHGDRLEALAGAVAGAFKNIYVCHIEGGEISGTIDESIRHAVSKLSHIHFVANERAKRRLVQMGEIENSVHVIGSPDIDLMLSKSLPKIDQVKKHYEIPFEKFSIMIFHPVTTINRKDLRIKTSDLISAVIESGLNYLVVKPNNDPGRDIIQEFYHDLKENDSFRIYPSIRFERFLTLLKHCDFIIGNSSVGIREAPVYGVPAINVGSRQDGRYRSPTIVDVSGRKSEILRAIKNIDLIGRESYCAYGKGKSDENFVRIMKKRQEWDRGVQKRFLDLKLVDNMGA